MKKRTLILPLTALTLSSCVTGEAGVSNEGWGVNVGSILNEQTLSTLLGASSALSQGEIGAALREALNIGTQTVVAQLGQTNGFNQDANIRIPLPQSLAKVDSALSMLGMNGLTRDLETRLNRAAEIATPRAKQYFIAAIQGMTIDDAKTILNGPQDAATQYLHKTMGADLANDITPIITQTLSESGAIQAYDSAVSRYTQIPLVSALAADSKTQLTNYVTDKALDGIFHYVATEEAAIRANPAKRTTELLRKVFGTQ
ncbi:MAG: DUF4197 domain-containing protein [Alphaproteobacteria bacterium]